MNEIIKARGRNEITPVAVRVARVKVKEKRSSSWPQIETENGMLNEGAKLYVNNLREPTANAVAIVSRSAGALAYK